MSGNPISVVIPAYKPDEKLISTVRGLVDVGFDDIIIVNDGSDESYDNIFNIIGTVPECTLLRHPINRGKGTALKTAFGFFLENRRGRVGVVTADADGQHLTQDIAAVAAAVCERDEIIIGARDFSSDNVPKRSKTGNRITSAVFRIFFSMRISDTQTGLRGFPAKYIKPLTEAKGDRFEYETNMLFMMNSLDIPFSEVPISTVYIDENRSSHFRVVRDSIRIYGRIIKYFISSSASAVTDTLMFWLLKHFKLFGLVLPIPITFTASIIARIVSSLLNYFLNAKIVFEGKANGRTLVKYYTLAAVQITVSALLVFATEKLFGVTAPILSTIIKMIVDTVLLLFSFRIQQRWVFSDKEKKK
ncbi:MAG: bifunctional glycosyltransferase family 2/GtrA family protein [Clostridia bacterium]|nr:bifunctional glycosyltransferase family 2/GtrA family protein [Clostridia bacterium]